MKTSERYARAASALHTSRDYATEVREMASTKKHAFEFEWTRPAAAAAMSAALLLGGGGVAYATDLGGLRTAVSLWINGQETQAEMEDLGGGAYSISYDGQEDDEGIYVLGEVYDAETGKARPMTAEEAASELWSNASLECDEQGRVWMSYYDQRLDITDEFDDEGVARMALAHEGETTYFEIRRETDGSFSYTCSSSEFGEWEEPEVIEGMVAERTVVLTDD